MTHATEHIGFDQLNDLVDGHLDNGTRIRLAEHLSRCQDCRSEHERLVAVLAAASGVPDSIDPGEDLWGGVRAAIESRKEFVLPTQSGAPVQRHVTKGDRPFLTRAPFMAAAAVVLIAASSGITTLVLRRANPSVAVVDSVPTRGLGRAELPVSFQATAAEYDRAIVELRLLVDSQRATLSPETVRTVDRSLAVVDSAIAEARAALIADPNNRMLVDLLAASYQRKLDLLRRTSELSSKI